MEPDGIGLFLKALYKQAPIKQELRRDKKLRRSFQVGYSPELSPRGLGQHDRKERCGDVG